MAKKKTFIYRVELGDGYHNPKTDFCYARNAKAAADGMKQIYPDRKEFSQIKAYAVGESFSHQDVFERITGEELDYLMASRNHVGEQYHRRAAEEAKTK